MRPLIPAEGYQTVAKPGLPRLLKDHAYEALGGPTPCWILADGVSSRFLYADGVISYQVRNTKFRWVEYLCSHEDVPHEVLANADLVDMMGKQERLL